MKSLWNRNIPLKRILYFSSATIVLTVSLTGVIASIAIFSLENSKRTKLIQDRLVMSVPHVKEVIFRQVLGAKDQNDESLNAILTEQKTLLDIPLIELRKRDSCGNLTDPKCIAHSSNYVLTFATFDEQIGSGLENSVLILGKERPSLEAWLILILIFPIAAILFLGVLIQRRILIDKILTPVLAMTEVFKSEKISPEFKGWPTELVLVHRQLKDLLKEREEASKKTFLQDLERSEEAQYIAGAYDSLHYAKTVLLDVLKYIENINDMPAGIRDKLREMINRPSAWINKLLSEQNRKKKFRPITSVRRTDPSRISTIGSVIQGIENDYTDKARQRGISFKSDFPKSLFHLYCQINYNSLFSAISNICSNALDAVVDSENKIVHLSTFVIGDNNEFCEIQIKDTGIAFSSATLDAIMGGEKHTTKSTGSGFGILSSKTTLEQVGGKLDILAFEEYKVIKLTVPLINRPEWIFDLRTITGRNVLILDDEPMLERVRRNLPFIGEHQIEQFTCEHEFINAARQDPHAALLVDYDYGDSAKKGIDLILEHLLHSQAVILSGRVLFNPDILNRVIEHKVKIYPKDFLQ